jgi:hypothetical protein
MISPRLRVLLCCLAPVVTWLVAYKLAGGEWAFLALNLLVLSSICIIATKKPKRALLWLVGLESVLCLCIGVLIASYHVNGCAWFDYGLEGWNPLSSDDERAAVFSRDYDPDNTKPFVWPLIGDCMAFMSVFAVVAMICPPTALICTAFLFVQVRRDSKCNRITRVAAITSIFLTSIFLIYMACWGGHVLDWLFD